MNMAIQTNFVFNGELTWKEVMFVMKALNARHNGEDELMEGVDVEVLETKSGLGCRVIEVKYGPEHYLIDPDSGEHVLILNLLW